MRSRTPMARPFDRFLRWFFDASPTQVEDTVQRDPVWSPQVERHGTSPVDHRQLRPQRRSTQPSRRS